MRRLALGVALASLFCSAESHAQQGLMGTYEATYPGYSRSSRRSPMTEHLTLEITAAENGKLAGKLNVARFDCRGDYLIEGTYRDGKLRMRTSEGTKAGCGNVRLALVSEGNKLVGTYGRTPVEFSKQ